MLSDSGFECGVISKIREHLIRFFVPQATGCAVKGTKAPTNTKYTPIKNPLRPPYFNWWKNITSRECQQATAEPLMTHIRGYAPYVDLRIIRSEIPTVFTDFTPRAWSCVEKRWSAAGERKGHSEFLPEFRYENLGDKSRHVFSSTPGRNVYGTSFRTADGLSRFHDVKYVHIGAEEANTVR
ncbi:hypothetical protein WG66_005338 [Moniliophthora roreri]|nr:hypothetical protein WG66_005338 [Moniliophthora roreri]